MTTLVTGATGIVGRNVVDQLVQAGEPVRALTRDPRVADLPADVEVIQGDLARPETLSTAFAGVDRLYLFPVAATAHEVLAKAKAAAVERVVVLSSGAVSGGLDTDFHLPVERAAEASGLEWTHVRPGEFSYNKVHLWGPSIRAERVVRYPNPDKVGVAPVHEADIAAVAVAALLNDGHDGVAYTFTGSEQLTLREQVQAISVGLGEEVAFEEVTTEEARRILKAQGGWGAANADMLLGFEDYSEDDEEWEFPEFSPEDLAEILKPTPEAVERVTGRPARSFTQWARDHVDDFR